MFDERGTNYKVFVKSFDSLQIQYKDLSTKYQALQKTSETEEMRLKRLIQLQQETIVKGNQTIEALKGDFLVKQDSLQRETDQDKASYMKERQHVQLLKHKIQILHNEIQQLKGTTMTIPDVLDTSEKEIYRLKNRIREIKLCALEMLNVVSKEKAYVQKQNRELLQRIARLEHDNKILKHKTETLENI